MISKAEKDRLKTIIGDTIALLCRNSITKFQKDFIVEGLIGITVDSEDLVLVSIKEAIKNPNAKDDSDGSCSGDASDAGSSISGQSSNRKRKRKRKKRSDGETPTKMTRPGNDDETDPPSQPSSYSDFGTPQMRTSASQGAHMDNSYSNDGGPSNDSSMFTLQEMKQDSDDDDNDLIEIIKEEPARYSVNREQIVSIQSLHHQQQQNPPQMSHMNMPPGMMMPGAPPGMGPPDGMPHMPMPSAQVGDLNEQVELMPGSGVYIKRATYNQLQFIDKGSKLVRKLVREIFPDVHLLASSSCMGKGETSAGLDRHKVEVIKGVAFERFCWNGPRVLSEIKHMLRSMKAYKKKSSNAYQRSVRKPSEDFVVENATNEQSANLLGTMLWLQPNDSEYE